MQLYTIKHWLIIAVFVAMPIWWILKVTHVSRVDKMASEVTPKPSNILYARWLVTNVLAWVLIIIFDFLMGYVHYFDPGRQNFLEGRELALATPFILLFALFFFFMGRVKYTIYIGKKYQIQMENIFVGLIFAIIPTLAMTTGIIPLT